MRKSFHGVGGVGEHWCLVGPAGGPCRKHSAMMVGVMVWALTVALGLSACSHRQAARSEQPAAPKVPPVARAARTSRVLSACPNWRSPKPLGDEALKAFVSPERRKACGLGFLQPAALAVSAAGRIWVVLGEPEKGLAEKAPIRILRMHAGTVVLTKSLGYGPAKGLTVQVHGSSGVLCRGTLGIPVILARLYTQSATNLPGNGRALSAEQSKQLTGFWDSASKTIAVEVLGCKAPADGKAGPVFAEEIAAGKQARLARDKALDPGVRQEALVRLRDLLAVQDKFKKAGPKEVYAKALAMPQGGTLLTVGAAWGDWPACGAQGQAGSALWYLFRGKWHLVRVWKGRTEPVKLLVAGDLDGDGAMECILEEDSFTEHRVLYHIRNKSASEDGEADGELIELRSDEFHNEGCPC